MACMKLGSKADAFDKQGQAWFCTTGLPSDIVVEVGDMSFHLHKFPLLSRSGVMEKMIANASKEGEENDSQNIVRLPDIPGGSKTFELVAKFCYGVRLELTAANVVYLRCAAGYLDMTEEHGEGNLVWQTETFLTQTVLLNWKDSLKALQTCDDVLEQADELNITKRCIESLAVKASTDPSLFGWPVMEHGGPMQSPGGSILWNGISTGARPKKSNSDWWYEDVSTLSFPLYKRLILAMSDRGIKQHVISGSLTFYAKRYLPGLNRRQKNSGEATPEEDQKILVEEIDGLLPVQKGIVSTKFLSGLLRTALILRASPSCLSNLEKRIGLQLDEASLDDLLMPTFVNSVETLYNVECVQHILEHFVAMDCLEGGNVNENENGNSSPRLHNDSQSLVGSPSLVAITKVAKLIDGYLAEIAPDVNLKLDKFRLLAAAIPDYVRPLDDGLYRAIDIYLKSHPLMTEPEREELCRLMDCQKLSIEACTHAAQNERLPLRTIVQVLFFEQLQLRSSIAGCFLVSDNLDGSRQLRSGGLVGAGAGAARENEVLKVGMDSMRMRVAELEKECLNMKQEIVKLGRAKGYSSTWTSVPKKIGFRLKSQMCSAQEGSVTNPHNNSSPKSKVADHKAKQQRRHGKLKKM